MVSKVRRLILAAMVATVAGSAALAETFEEIEKKVTEATKNTKSLSAKQKMDMKNVQGQFSMIVESEGTLEQVRQGDKVFLRNEATTKTEQKFGDQEIKGNNRTLLICDGEATYTLSDQDGNKSCMKSEAVKDELPWSSMKDDFEIKVLPEEKIDGADCYTLELVPKDPAQAAMISRTVYHIRKDCGLMVKYATFDPEGKQVASMVMTDVKVNENIPAERFKFEAPAGMTCLDQPGM